MPGVGVVIPCVEAHDRFLGPLLQSLKPDSGLIDKVVVARSGLRKSAIQAYRIRLAEMQSSFQLTFPIELSPSTKRQTAGQNRNRGWELISSPLTAFLDADDLYVPQRITKLHALHSFNSPVNLIVHNYIRASKSSPKAPWEMQENFPPNEVELVRNEAIFNRTFQRERRRELEGTSPGDTNLLIPRSTRGEWPVAHGHVFVSTPVREHVRFFEGPPGPYGGFEDGQFCRDVLEHLGGVLYSSEVMSLYRPQNSGQSPSRARPSVRSLRLAMSRFSHLMRGACPSRQAEF